MSALALGVKALALTSRPSPGQTQRYWCIINDNVRSLSYGGCHLVGWLEFNVPFQHKYGYIRDDVCGYLVYYVFVILYVRLRISQRRKKIGA